MGNRDEFFSFILITIGFGLQIFSTWNNALIMKHDIAYVFGTFFSIAVIPLFILFLYYISDLIFKKKYNYLRIFAWTFLICALLMAYGNMSDSRRGKNEVIPIRNVLSESNVKNQYVNGKFISKADHFEVLLPSIPKTDFFKNGHNYGVANDYGIYMVSVADYSGIYARDDVSASLNAFSSGRIAGLPNAKIISSELISYKGFDALGVKLKYSIKGASFDYIEIYFIANGKPYALAVSYFPENEDMLNPSIKDFFNSFKILQ